MKRVRRRCSPKFTILPNEQCIISGMSWSQMSHLVTLAALTCYRSLEAAKQSGKSEEYINQVRTTLEMVELLDRSKQKALQRHNDKLMKVKKLPPQPLTQSQRKAKLLAWKAERDLIDSIVDSAINEPDY